jgi:DNA-binding NarL/FixJ family response regulator
MEHLSSDMEHQNQEHKEQQQIQWRRDKVQELCSKGYSQTEIARALHISESIISRDLDYLRE